MYQSLVQKRQNSAEKLTGVSETNGGDIRKEEVLK
jgi:hypothetical protein